MDAPSTSNRQRRQGYLHSLSMRYLLIVPIFLSITTATVLFVHSDVNVAMLFSQCHARARLPLLSRIPLLGTPSCFLVSFIGEALASARAFAVMSVVLSFIAGLLTISTVESARICNGPSILIAYPTGPWLVFNLFGGAVVWELVIIPAFFRRSKQIIAAQVSSVADASPAASHAISNTTSLPNNATAHDTPGQMAAVDPNVGPSIRHLAVASEVVAIPIAVTVGYILPSLMILIFDSPLTIGIWLFFPLYVNFVRRIVRSALLHKFDSLGTVYLESHRPSLLAAYAMPIICSALSYGLLIWSLTRPDDRRDMTRSTLRFIEIDSIFIGLTVIYWILVEAGWKVVLTVIAVSLILGPGAGLSFGWIYRERRLGFIGDEEDGDRGPDEHSRLLS